jgi:hypothetical protein
MRERPLRDVPRFVLATLAVALAVQCTLRLTQSGASATTQDLDAPPNATSLRLAALGDPVPLAKLLMLYLQSFDLRADNPIHFQALDYGSLTGWLGQILALDPGGQYPLHAASRVYAEIPNAAKTRVMLDFVYGEFLKDPEQRWAWLAHAASIAKHRLHDLELARRYAAAIQQYATGPRVPLWARQMEAFILEDMNELEAARIMIGGFVASGQVTEPGELRFLEERMKQIEARLRADKEAPKANMPSASRQK